MSRSILNKLLSAAAVFTLCLLVPGQAEARFGKSGSGSHSSSGGSHGGGTHSASSPGSSSSGSSSGSSPGGRYYQGGSYVNGGYNRYTRPVYQNYYYSPYYSCWRDPFCTPYAWGFGYRPLWGYAQPTYVGPSAGAYVTVQPQEDHPFVLSASADAQGYVHGGGGLGVSLAVEKNRLGLEGRFTGVFVPADDGSNTTDQLKLFDLHITYALLQGDHGRLKVGFGLDTVFAQDVIMAGPAASASVALGLVGPVGAEASIDVVLAPFTKVDMKAGLALGLGPVGIRAGWRRLYLNDNGFVDNVAHEDLFNGPYVSLGVTM